MTERTDIYVIWHDWANYHEATFTDRNEAAVYVRRVRRLGPRHLTRLTIYHNGQELRVGQS